MKPSKLPLLQMQSMLHLPLLFSGCDGSLENIGPSVAVMQCRQGSSWKYFWQFEYAAVCSDETNLGFFCLGEFGDEI